MKSLFGVLQLFFVIAVGTWTYSEEPKGGLVLHLLFACLYSYWIRLGFFKVVPYVERWVRRLASGGTTVLTSDSNNNFGNWIAILAISLLPLAGLAIVGLQTYAWLRSGVWFPFSVIDGAKLIFEYQWLAMPVDWIGLHNVLTKIPLSVVLVFGGGLLLFSALEEVN